MALFGHKKTRTVRAATLRASTTLAGRLDETLQDRSVLPRLLLCLAAVVALVFAVQGWKAPFPHRVGDRALHGITARVAFHLQNDFETERRRLEREAQEPFIFKRDPKPLQRLPVKLGTDLRNVAEAETIDDLSHVTQAAFGLSTFESTADNLPTVPHNMDQEFATLKAAVSSRGDAVRTRIDAIIADFEQFFVAKLVPTGIVDPDELDRYKIDPESTIAIVSTAADGDQPDGSGVKHVSAADVQLSKLLEDTGIVGKTWADYPKLSAIRPMLRHWLLTQAPFTLHYNAAATKAKRKEARDSVERVYDSYSSGDLLVEPGELVDEKALAILRAEYDEVEAGVPGRQRLLRVLTVFGMFAVLAVLYSYYLLRNEGRLVTSVSRLGIYLATVVLAVVLGRLFSFDPWRAEVIPLMATAMVFAIAYNQLLATLTAFTLSLVITLSTVVELGQFVVLLSVAATAVTPLRRVRSRLALIKVGFWTGAVYFVVSWGTGILSGQPPSEVWSDTALLLSSLRGAGWCLVTGYLVAGSLPFIESAFGVVTDISLLEMSDISHPLLQELVRRAPGTYNHSISVATIGEAAADRIGANGLLVRVGTYFHDIGKMLKPHYFVENMTEQTRSSHERLAPAMSTLIIIGHVKDGVDLARHHNLPQRILDFIEQHHGTTLVEYFFHEATRQAGQQPDHKSDAEESSFRYPGPKPQSRETGVMMLADAVESASRTLSEPTSKRIEGLVHEITMKRLLDGQFDECSLTLSEIHTVEDSLSKSLIGIYHGRIKYPEQRTA